jgi:hypothetical protein
LIRRLAQIGTFVLLVVMSVIVFVMHDPLSGMHRVHALTILYIVCIAYMIALELCKGSPGLVLFFVCSGLLVTGFTGGFLSCYARDLFG